MTGSNPSIWSTMVGSGSLAQCGHSGSEVGQPQRGQTVGATLVVGGGTVIGPAPPPSTSEPSSAGSFLGTGGTGATWDERPTASSSVNISSRVLIRADVMSSSR